MSPEGHIVRPDTGHPREPSYPESASVRGLSIGEESQRQMLAMWPQMLDCPFHITDINHASETISVSAGYLWGFTKGIAIAAVANIAVSGGTVSAPLFVYASGSAKNETGTIAATGVVLASVPFGAEDTWVYPLYRVYTATSGLLRIMPLMFCPNIRSHYGP